MAANLLAESAVAHVAEGGSIAEGMAIALGRIAAPTVLLGASGYARNEDAAPRKKQTQVWYLPDEDKVNRFVNYAKNKEDLNTRIDGNEQPPGYRVTVTGVFSDGEIANIIGSLNGYPLEGANQPGSLGEAKLSKAQKAHRATAAGQKEMWATAQGLPSDTYVRRTLATKDKRDHGHDPLGNGKFRMVPSGDVVDTDEMRRRLKRFDRR